jgi:NAD(P)-dependent dehydrogenase (short-subunit alcohol dehydrogenase family)
MQFISPSVDEKRRGGHPALAVVTGSASGIGRATVSALRARGTTVVGVDLNPAPGEAGEDPGVDWIEGDVADQETWDRVASACEVRDRAGADALITCAAKIVVSPFIETAPADWERLFRINVVGVIRGMQKLMPAMSARGGGAVAVVCSVNSLIVEQEMSAYSTSKAALLHAVRSAAIEHAAEGVRINAVCPGIIDTPLLQSHFSSLDDPEGARRDAERRSPIGRLLQPEEVAETLCFLVDRAASGLAGSALTVDGGLIATYDFDPGPPQGA